MTRRFGSLLNRFADRPDSEHGQAIVRLVIAVLTLAYLNLQYFQGSLDRHVQLLFLIIMAEGLLGFSLILAISFQPGVSHLRRCIGMFADYSTLTALMALGGNVFAPLYIIILWVTIGNGLRYGSRYLFSATALGLVGFLFVIWKAEFWRHQPYLAGGLWFGLIAIPLHLSPLLKKVNQNLKETQRTHAAKSAFLTTMNHQCQSPLSGIMSMSEKLRETRLESEQREYADVIKASAKTLSLLTNNVRNISGPRQ